jgi:hypothetical protein
MSCPEKSRGRPLTIIAYTPNSRLVVKARTCEVKASTYEIKDLTFEA